MRPLSLYIHVPFCTRRCAYCSFYHLPRDRGAEALTVDALAEELDLAIAPLGASLRTVFLGGGTPSVLDRADLARLFEAVARHVDPGGVEEFTCELNPEDVTDELLVFLQGHGVTRVSLGVQSMDPAAQRVLKRCAPDANRRAIALVAARFQNVSFDVLLGVPGAPEDALDRTLDELLASRAPHFSVYCLEPGGDAPPSVARFFDGVDSERSASEYLRACDRLRAEGYGHYEVSNFARPGFESVHNRVYWGGGEFLGVGPAAHSFVGGVRFHNSPSLDDYLRRRGADRLAARVVDHADAAALELERMMLGLRTADGVPVAWARCGAGELDDLETEGLAHRHGGRVVLTDRGCLVMNEIVLRLARPAAAA